MSAQIIDLAATADIVRALKATGQKTIPVLAREISARIGDTVYDTGSKLCGHFTGYAYVNGQQYAVVQACGCSLAAKLRDLVPVKHHHVTPYEECH